MLINDKLENVDSIIVNIATYLNKINNYRNIKWILVHIVVGFVG